ncbi:MAG TPA: phosphatase PAP2 family protein [Thermoanaerobaculia bacterium]|jgi:membrane-associated phospholipid phosphatase|nr:phosphatase PAP2 family protein [Thermoanaerobaculia bacterium]
MIAGIHTLSRAAFCLLAAAILGSSPAAAQTPDAPSSTDAGSASAPAVTARSLPHLVLVDLRDVLGAPIDWKAPQWGRFSLAVAGVGAAALLDRRVRDWESHDHNHRVDQVAQDFEPLGSGGAFVVLGTFYLEGILRNDAKARSVTEDGLIASLIAGGIITPALKYVTGRSRPHDATRTFDFHAFGGKSSFPSGHTTEAFAVASVIATEYDSGWIKGVAYGSAVLVGFARIHHQAHFFSDVAAGAVVGTAVGRAVVHRNREERRRLQIAPLVGPRNQPGLGVSLSF